MQKYLKLVFLFVLIGLTQGQTNSSETFTLEQRPTTSDVSMTVSPTTSNKPSFTSPRDQQSTTNPSEYTSDMTKTMTTGMLTTVTERLQPTSSTTEEPDPEFELRLTRISFTRRGQLWFSWDFMPQAMIEDTKFSLECRTINTRNPEEVEGDVRRMSAVMTMLKPGKVYSCCVEAENENTNEDLEQCVAISLPSPQPLRIPQPPPMPNSQTNLTVGGVASLSVTIALFVVMVIVWVIIGVVMCRRRSKSVSFNTSSYENQYKLHQQSPALPARNLGMQQPRTSYTTLSPMYELIPDPTYEHINRGPTGNLDQSNGNSTVEERVVTRKSHDPQYHVLEQSSNKEDNTPHDLEDKPGVPKEKTKDHTYHVLENSPSPNTDNPQKLDNERPSEQETKVEDPQTSGGQNKTDSPSQICPLEQLTSGEVQEYEVPTCSLPVAQNEMGK